MGRSLWSRMMGSMGPAWHLGASAAIAVLVAVIGAQAYLRVAQGQYSLRQLALALIPAIGLLVWPTWRIVGAFRRRIALVPRPSRFHRVLLSMAMVLGGYVTWAGSRAFYEAPVRKYQVEIGSPHGSRAQICLLGFGAIQGTLQGRRSDAVTDVTLTGGWSEKTGGCWLNYNGATGGNATFHYSGPMDELELMFGPAAENGEPQIRVNGRPPAAIRTRHLQSGATLRTVQLDPTAMAIWNLLGTAGSTAVLLLAFMALAISTAVQLPRSLGTWPEFVGRHRWIVPATIGALLLLLFWPATFPYSPDVGYYLSLAKSIFHGKGYVNPDLTAAIYRGPVFPLLISASYLIFGESFRSALILERIFWVLTIVVAYLLGRRLFNREAGLLACLLVLGAGVVEGVYRYIWADGIVTTLILAVQLLMWDVFERQRGPKWYALMGGLLGTAYLAKQTALFLAPLPFLLWALFHRYRTRTTARGLLLYTFVCTSFVVGWIGYVLAAGGSFGQATADFKEGASYVSYIGRAVAAFIVGAPIPSSGARASGTLLSPIVILYRYYQGSIVPHFAQPVFVPLTLIYTALQAVLRRSRPSAFLGLGLLLFSVLIPIQVAADFGPRHDLYFHVIVLICLAALLADAAKVLWFSLHRELLILAGVTMFVLAAVGAPPRAFSADRYRQPITYFAEYQEMANWIDGHVGPEEAILVESRIADYLHVLTADDKSFATLNTCEGDGAFEPFRSCSPPYISFWIYGGVTNPDNPRGWMRGISEPELLATIRSRDVRYIIVTPNVYSLHYYLKQRRAFKEVADFGSSTVFRVLGSAATEQYQGASNSETCLGAGTSEYLRNLRMAAPARYAARLRDEIGPWMGLSAEDLLSFENWRGCEF